MNIILNSAQKNALSTFFINIAVLWFIGAFITPQIAPSFGSLTIFRYLGNMVLALYLAMFLLKEEI